VHCVASCRRRVLNSRAKLPKSTQRPMLRRTRMAQRCLCNPSLAHAPHRPQGTSA
jgi:hypothetical protein